MPRQLDVTVAGQLCLDIIPTIPIGESRSGTELLTPGKLIHVNGGRISPGGPVANVGLALNKMGFKVAMVARIGEDDFGRILTEQLQASGCHLNLIITATGRTSYTIAISPPGIDRMFLYHSGVNDSFASSDLKRALLNDTKIFHFGYPPSVASSYRRQGEDLIKMFQRVKSAGCTTSLDATIPDPNSPAGQVDWRTLLARVLPYVDLFLPSIEDVLCMWLPDFYFQIKEKAGKTEVIPHIPPEIYTALAADMLELGCKVIGIKTGFRGMYIATADLTGTVPFGSVPPGDRLNWSRRELWCPAFVPDRIASATGSGDAAVAGFLAAYLNGLSIEKTLQYANCLGCQNLVELDGTSSIATWRKTKQMLEQGNLELIPIPQLSESGWVWDRKNRLWVGKQDRKMGSAKSTESEES